MSEPTPELHNVRANALSSEQARRKWRRTVVQSTTSSFWSSWMVPTEFVMGLRMLASQMSASRAPWSMRPRPMIVPGAAGAADASSESWGSRLASSGMPA